MEKRKIKHEKVLIHHQERYILIDEETGEIVDNAQGYGYKTIKGAYSAYKYKSLSTEERREREHKIHLVHQWCKKNKKMVRLLEQIHFEIFKGSWGPNDQFDEKTVGEILVNNGYEIEKLGFSIKELLKYGKDVL